MGSPDGFLALVRRAFQLQTAAAVCHQKTRRPVAQPPALGAGRKASNFLFFFQKESWTKKNAPSGKVFRSLRGATKGAAFGNQPFGHVGFAQPFEKGGPKLYRPSALLIKIPGTHYRPPKG